MCCAAFIQLSSPLRMTELLVSSTLCRPFTHRRARGDVIGLLQLELTGSMAGITGALYAVLGYLPPLSKVASPAETAVQAPPVAKKTCAEPRPAPNLARPSLTRLDGAFFRPGRGAPTPLELISSPDPALWTRMVDLTSMLPSNVHQFNALNPGSEIKLMAKCEHMNPGMSHKDRIAKAMLERAEKRGELRGPNGEKKTILAASSGNTGALRLASNLSVRPRVVRPRVVRSHILFGPALFGPALFGPGARHLHQLPRMPPSQAARSPSLAH